jgi:CRISPR-associated protein Cas8a1/Csx13
MTLEVLEKQGWKSEDLGASWTRSETGITISWAKDGKALFDKLRLASFRISPLGFFHFTGIGDPADHPSHAVVLQDAILGTVLQHGRTRKADEPTKPQGNVSVEIDEEAHIINFRRVFGYAHQSAEFDPLDPLTLAGWHYPGGTVRHVAHGESTALQEPPARGLALLFLPVGAIFFRIDQRAEGPRSQFAMVLPELRSLRQNARARRHLLRFGVAELQAPGAGVAALRVMAELKASGLAADLGCSGCRVFSFGTVPWNKQQKTRLDIFRIHDSPSRSLEIFRTCENALPPRFVRRDDKEPFWSVPQMPELVARNLVHGAPWWSGFGEFVASMKRRDAIFGYEKGGLNAMVMDDTALPTSSQKTFVLACHEAWRRRMGQIREKANRENSSFERMVEREFIRLRSAFARAKNPATIREVVTDFWVRGGSNTVLQDRWAEVLPLFGPQSWKTARDLALLALASYKSSNPQGRWHWITWPAKQRRQENNNE